MAKGETFGDILRREVRANFVPREEARASLEAAFEAAREFPQIVELVGPGGVGKSSVVRHFRAEVEGRGAKSAWLECGAISPNRQALAKAVSEMTPALGELGFDATPALLVFDAFEHIANVESWLLESALPALGPHVVLAFTTRVSLSARTRTEISKMIHRVELSNFTREESLQLLRLREIPEEDHDAILRLTKGHPLAVALTVAQYRQDSSYRVSENWNVDAVPLLARDFMRDVPSEAHADVLYSMAIIGELSENTLSHALGSNVRELYEWARDLSFVESGPRGLLVHDLVKDVLYRDLAVRNRPRLLRLVQACTSALLGDESVGDLTDLRDKFVHAFQAFRFNPAIQEQIENDSLRETHLREARDDEEPRIVEFIRRYAGEAEAATYVSLASLMTTTTHLVFDETEKIVGISVDLELSKTPPEAREADIVLARCYDHWRSTRQGEEVGGLCFRWYTAIQPGAAEAGPSVILFPTGPIAAGKHSGRLAHWYFPKSDAEKWAPAAPLFGLKSAGVVHRDDEAFTVFHMTTELQGSVSALREMRRILEGLMPPLLDEESQTSPIVKILPSERRNIIRHALRFSNVPNELRRSPLCTTETSPWRGAPQRLSVALTSTLEQLRKSSGDDQSVRVLEETYFKQSRKQLAVAATLRLPFGTYRYQLRKAVDLFAREFFLLHDGTEPR